MYCHPCLKPLSVKQDTVTKHVRNDTHVHRLEEFNKSGAVQITVTQAIDEAQQAEIAPTFAGSTLLTAHNKVFCIEYIQAMAGSGICLQKSDGMWPLWKKYGNQVVMHVH